MICIVSMVTMARLLCCFHGSIVSVSMVCMVSMVSIVAMFGSWFLWLPWFLCVLLP